MVLFDGLSARVTAVVSLLVNPALIIIDHGHFQYNNISLGLAVSCLLHYTLQFGNINAPTINPTMGMPCTLQVGAVVLIARRRYLGGAILFCCSLNHKQMSLYFAPAFFAHLFGLCLRQETWPQKVGVMISLVGINAAEKKSFLRLTNVASMCRFFYFLL
jgi:hypothetical protein